MPSTSKKRKVARTGETCEVSVQAVIDSDKLKELMDWCYEEIKDRTKAQEDQVTAERSALAQDKETWEALATKLSKTQLPKRVNLDVGGTKFSASAEDLTRYPDTYFSALLSGRWDVNPTETIFINRSPVMFHAIMDFLRGDDTVTEGLSEADLKKLAKETDYYQLEKSVAFCNPSSVVQEHRCFWETTGEVFMSENGTVATRIGNGGNAWDSCALGDEMKFPSTGEPLIEQSIRLLTEAELISVGLGLKRLRNARSFPQMRESGRYFTPMQKQTWDKGVGLWEYGIEAKYDDIVTVMQSTSILCSERR